MNIFPSRMVLCNFTVCVCVQTLALPKKMLGLKSLVAVATWKVEALPLLKPWFRNSLQHRARNATPNGSEQCHWALQQLLEVSPLCANVV